MKSGKGGETKKGALYETALLMYEPKRKEGIKLPFID